MGSQPLDEKKKNPVGRPKAGLITPMRRKVLRQIAHEGFQTYSELKRNLFESVSRQYAFKFLKDLVHAGLLVEARGDEGGILGWSLSEDARKRLKVDPGQEWQAQARPPQYRTSFSHDVILRSVKAILCESPLVTDWRPEHATRRAVMMEIQGRGEAERRSRLSKIPDAHFSLDVSGKRFRCALELELTRKSRRRIFDRIEAHIINPKLDFIFFVVSDESHLKVLWEVYQQVLAKSFRVSLRPSENAVYFALLENVQNQGLHANFRGLRRDFSFDSLRFNSA